MSEQVTANLAQLLEQSGLLGDDNVKAKKVDDSMQHLQWGSANIVVGITEHALVVISPMFHELPAGKELAFLHRLLQANSVLGGMASFAIQPDGWVVLQSGRDLKGMDAHEFAFVVRTVATAADEFDDLLYSEFYAEPKDEAAGETAGEAADETAGEAAGEAAAEASDDAASEK